MYSIQFDRFNAVVHKEPAATKVVAAKVPFGYAAPAVAKVPFGFAAPVAKVGYAAPVYHAPYAYH